MALDIQPHLKTAAFAQAPVTPEKLAAVLEALTRRQVHIYDFKMPESLRGKCTYSAEAGPKYTRIIRTDHGSRSAFAFLENSTGLILKCDGWKRPAKHARGTVHTETHGLEFFGPYGPAYLR